MNNTKGNKSQNTNKKMQNNMPNKVTWKKCNP